MMKRALALAATLCVVASGLAGCAQVRDRSGKITTPTVLSWSESEVGDCIANEVKEGALLKLPFVPCDQPHVGQVFCIASMPETEYPTDEEAGRDAHSECLPRFKSFFGGSYYAATDYDYTWIIPDKVSWAKGSHLIRAVLQRVDGAAFTGDLEGTMKGLPNVVGSPDIGQCTAKPVPGKWRGGLGIVDCNASHYYEVFAAQRLTTQPTSDAELKAQSDAFCKTEYKTFTGVAFTGAGGLVILPIHPSVEEWARTPFPEISCFVGKIAGGVVGSLKGSMK